MDDDLRSKATECIQNNFSALLETREFHSLPAVQIELVRKDNRINLLIQYNM